ncbi:TRAM domain-containing protein [Pseudarthrobacter sp. PS3-L1]|uniref:class I SAM-dependent RNA methyltransferase n=1 Tax=Pseudarthrobacter sp. PS3-L1 TaxID=3046207 RepID=UPI0024BB66F6|nr:TRAM domain-containing protein [Pseudarthrobacter sp. PS3-L1]MDJ0320318.1 TRAM domain-containing protein [Pseudarthrobacter sp. PS3-L1]
MNEFTQPNSAAASEAQQPTEVVIDVGPVAHGGHCVARYQGRVIFVRHAVPGEKVKVRITDAGENAKFWRADTIEVLAADPERVEHFWHAADPLRTWANGHAPVGGAEFGHMTLAKQRELKAAVLTEQLQRLAGLDVSVEVQGVGVAPSEPSGTGPDAASDAGSRLGASGTEGLGWRTRAAYSMTRGGRLGMHAHRSEDILAVREMPLAVQAINDLALWDLDLDGITRVEVAAPANGSAPLVLLVPAAGTKPRRLRMLAAQVPGDASVAALDAATGAVTQLRGRTWLQETAAGHDYRVSGGGFWQIHKAGPDTLVAAVLELLTGAGHLRDGSSVADLYAGAGLFTVPLAAAVGESGTVLSIEGAAGSSRDARKNVRGAAQVEIIEGRVEKVLRSAQRSFDSIVLDPPRAGAGKAVIGQLLASAPKAIAYVSCDPASFARDVGYVQEGGWELSELRAFDLYPHTHHLETVALLTPKGATP